jgi:hypothetical protein
MQTKQSGRVFVLLLYLSWVDGILIAGSKASVMKAKASLQKHFTLDEKKCKIFLMSSTSHMKQQLSRPSMV